MNALRVVHQGLSNMVGGTAAVGIEIAVAILFLGLLGIILRGQFSEKARRQRVTRRRFETLATVHNMVKPDRLLLLEMARQLGLEEPSMLFVRRALFETASARLPCDPRQVDTLRKELFY